MVWLRMLSRLVLMQIMVAALTLLGLVLLGAAPAAAAAARVAGPVRRDEALPLVRTMWHTWRALLGAANLAAAPATLLMVAAAGNLLLLSGGGLPLPGPLAGLLAGVAALILLLGALVWLVSVVLVGEQGSTASQALRAAVLLPIAFPGTALSLLVTLAGAALIGMIAPVLAVLCGASAVVMATELIVSIRRRILQAHLAAP